MPAKNSLDSKQMIIVGGRGRMGVLFQRLFCDHGFDVRILDKEDTFTKETFQTADYVLLAVSIAHACTVAAQIGPLLPAQALFFDINSLKQDVCAAMAKSFGGEVLGLHPMFGPTVKDVVNQKIIFCPVRSGSKSQEIIVVLKAMGAALVESTPQHHDVMMSYVQVLLHFSKLAFGAVLARSGVPIEEMLKFVSPVYQLELAMIGRIFAQDPELYAQIELQNNSGNAVRQQYADVINALTSTLAMNDGKGFVDQFKEVGQYLQSFSAEALQISDFVISELARKEKNSLSKS